MHPRPDDAAVLLLGPVKLVVFLGPSGVNCARWFLEATGELLGGQRAGVA